MWNWFERWVQRQNDLEKGVDADLVEGNRRKWKLVFWFMGCGALLLSLDGLFLIPIWFRRVVLFSSALMIIAGFLLLRWASAEHAFLNRPEPKEPPSIFKR
jgi:hypothetical protein